MAFTVDGLAVLTRKAVCWMATPHQPGVTSLSGVWERIRAAAALTRDLPPRVTTDYALLLDVPER
jgi:hypothetical protein